MSLFDVIKYPISYPPTVEELNALPETIYNKWRSGCLIKWPYHNYINQWLPENAYSSMKYHYDERFGLRDVIDDMIHLLRKIIEEC